MDTVDSSIPLRLGRGFDLASTLKEADEATQSQLATDYARQTQDDRVSLYHAGAQSQLATYGATTATQKQNLLNTNRHSLASIMAAPQTADEWDAAMRQAVQEGHPEAQQYIGRYNPDRQAEWVTALSADDAGSQLAAYRGTGDTAVGSPLAGTPGLKGADPALSEKFAAMTPEDRAKVSAHLTQVKSAIDQVESSDNPQAAFNQAVTQFGHPEWVNQPWQQRIAQIKQVVLPAYNALGAVQLQSQLGVPTPQAAAKLEHIGGSLVAVSGDPANPNAKEIYADPNGAGGRSSVYQQKRQAWLDTHPGDNQGALDYASGHKAAGMASADIRKAAAAQAARDLQAATLAGEQITNPDQWRADREARLVEDLTSANANDKAAATGGGNPRFRSNGYPMPSAQDIAMLRQNPQQYWRYFDKHFGPQASAHALNPTKYGPLQ